MISIGEELKREREFREISLREISDATKNNIRMLEAIEKDHFESLPGGIFNRNFIRAYAEFIGLDPEVIIRKYIVQTGNDQETKLPPSLVVPVPKVATRSSKRAVLWLLILMILILVVLVMLWKFPDQLHFIQRKLSSIHISLVLS
jgi:cytoskeleton protein RodZ